MPEVAFPRQTSGLLLRPLGPQDREAICRMYRDWSVAKWLSRLLWPFTPESADTFIADAESPCARCVVLSGADPAYGWRVCRDRKLAIARAGCRSVDRRSTARHPR